MAAIKNRQEVIFKPNNKQKCKALHKRGCPFFIWAYPMVSDKNTVQIKLVNLQHSCTREQYSHLHDYKLELLKTNLGSIITFELDEGKFKSMYVCFATLKNRFKVGCRPLISIDGTWLKGVFGGELLTAVGIDANDCIFPIAWAIV